MDEFLLKLKVEDLLVTEAACLDEWRLEDWLALYTGDAEYLVPSTDVDGDNADPDRSLFYVFDDRKRMEERVIRLGKKGAHSEWPRSKTRHLVTNVRAGRGANSVTAKASFAVWRSKDTTSDVYVGHYVYDLAETGAGLRIRRKLCVLDMEALRPHGRISIIL